MNPHPIIGIPTQTQDAVPDKLPPCWIMSQRYIRVLASAGALPWLIPLLEDDPETLRGIYQQLDGVFLTGGVDMDPATYGETRDEMCGLSDLARDRTELALIRWAVADQKPVLAVCRGIQVLNVAGGGTLHQDLNAHAALIKHDYWPGEGGFPRNLLSHSASIVELSRLNQILGAASVKVNSMHHQGIKDLASGLTASAFAPDGLIEGVESTNGHFMIGVQWHPEELVESEAPMRRLFAAFLQAASEFQQGLVR